MHIASREETQFELNHWVELEFIKKHKRHDEDEAREPGGESWICEESEMDEVVKMLNI